MSRGLISITRRELVGGGVMLGLGLGVASAALHQAPVLKALNPVLHLNGSTNASLKAAVARVRGGTGRGKVLFKGDSTTVGQGAGSNNANSTAYLIGARPYRVPSLLAGLLTNAGTRALDVGLVADNGTVNGGIKLDDYDPRVSTHTWTRQFNQDFSGGGYLIVPDAAGEPLAVDFTDPTDTLEVVHYSYGNYPYNVALDGAAVMAANTGATSGFGKAMQTAARGSGRQSLLNTVAPANAVALCSFRAYDSTLPALDFIVDASCGATAAQQTSSSANGIGGWSALAHIAFEAPDLTVFNLGLNDDLQGVPLTTTTSALQNGITAAKAVGDVLIVVPHPIDPAKAATATQRARNEATKQLAAQNSVACLSLFDAFQSFDAISGSLVDGVHGTAAFYAQVASLEKSALDLMIV